jgi:transcriptional regulator of arginine metabolism
MQRASPSRSERDARRARIAELVRERTIASQLELQERLAAEGVDVNQATLSRDLRAMGLRKGPEGYELPAEPAAAARDESLALYTAVQAWLIGAESAGNLVVVKSPAGAASPLAIALDRAGWKDVVGTIAGDDTLLAVCKTDAGARRVARELHDLKGPKSA